jgi:hypothetical protein
VKGDETTIILYHITFFSFSFSFFLQRVQSGAEPGGREGASIFIFFYPCKFFLNTLNAHPPPLNGKSLLLAGDRYY